MKLSVSGLMDAGRLPSSTATMTWTYVGVFSRISTFDLVSLRLVLDFISLHVAQLGQQSVAGQRRPPLHLEVENLPLILPSIHVVIPQMPRFGT